MFTCDLCFTKLDSNRTIQKLIDALLRTLNYLSLDALVAHGRDISRDIRHAVSNHSIHIYLSSKNQIGQLNQVSETRNSNVVIWCFQNVDIFLAGLKTVGKVDAEMGRGR